MARIIIVEEDASTTSEVETLLQGFGHTVMATAGSGSQALQLATAIQPDLVLFNPLFQGQGDGVAAIETIQSQLKIPVLYLTDLSQLYNTIELTLMRRQMEAQLATLEQKLLASAKPADPGSAPSSADAIPLPQLPNPAGERAGDVSPSVPTAEAWQHQVERTRLVRAIAQRISRSLCLEEILQTTADEVRQGIKTDRVILYRLESDWCGTVIVESVTGDWRPMLGHKIAAPCFSIQEWVERYAQGEIQVMENLETAGFAPGYHELLASFQVKSHLLVPIVQGKKLWGLLIAQHCAQPHVWRSWEIELLRELSTHVGIALQQAELYRKVQQFNSDLERQVEERTLQFQRALDFEALLKRITDRVRDSLDESQILQIAVQELATELKTWSCDTGLYDSENGTSTIAYEYLRTRDLFSIQGQVVSMADYQEVYQLLLGGEAVQFCWLTPETETLRVLEERRFAILACPLRNDQGVIGDMWIYKAADEFFDAAEIRLVQQVANQCAIALRQAQLYQATQAQVTELERLNHLKDDFLNSISHELRTPISSIRMASQMLEIRLRQAGLLESESAHPDIGRYLNILQDECDREIKLINNMLDLSRLDAQVEPTTLNTIRLQDWIPHLLEPFTARMEKQQQRLQIDVPQDLPAIKSDLFNLGRILTELLNNACKYTPAGETIRVAAQIMANEQSPYLPVVPPALEPMTTLHIGNGGSVVQQSNPDVPPPLPTPRSTGRVVDLFNRSHKTTKSTSTPPSSLFVISISNSGVEIPVAEQRRIFEKFYRIPTVDFWKHGGTGLGLALVQRLAMHLGGEISVNSAQQWTTFALRIPKRG